MEDRTNLNGLCQWFMPHLNLMVEEQGLTTHGQVVDLANTLLCAMGHVNHWAAVPYVFWLEGDTSLTLCDYDLSDLAP